jgi:pimeloyl-ACP methyl ester carboxylesterase
VTTFALIHGAWGSAWHWASVPEELRALGHDVIAPDLPCDTPGSTYDDYADVVEQAVRGVVDDLVLVAFSLGGLTAPLVAARRPVDGIVYVAGVLAEPGRSVAERLRGGEHLFHGAYRAGVAPAEEGLIRWTDLEVYQRVAYDADVDDAVVAERFRRLRAQSFAGDLEPCPLAAHPEVPTAYLLCEDDRLLDTAYWGEAVPRLLGIEPTPFPGAHTPMPRRPAELARAIAAA